MTRPRRIYNFPRPELSLIAVDTRHSTQAKRASTNRVQWMGEGTQDSLQLMDTVTVMGEHPRLSSPQTRCPLTLWHRLTSSFWSSLQLSLVHSQSTGYHGKLTEQTVCTKRALKLAALAPKSNRLCLSGLRSRAQQHKKAATLRSQRWPQRGPQSLQNLRCTS